ncbi:hypothetical protein SRHO_G00120480 [Serrasalmus rhombeus]
MTVAVSRGVGKGQSQAAPGTAGTAGGAPVPRVLSGSACPALAPQLSARPADDAKVWGERADNEGTILLSRQIVCSGPFRGAGELRAAPRPLSAFCRRAWHLCQGEEGFACAIQA